MTLESRDAHLFSDGPKRILALDGGGIKGLLTLQILREIEKIVKRRIGAEGRLCDYFDLIGGTSTGSIIAAGLAIGKTVDELHDLYWKLGNSIFDRGFFRFGLLAPKFPVDALREALEEQFGDITLGSDELETGLAIVAKRLDTGSPWVLHNNPKGKYFGQRPGSSAAPNQDYLLRDIVRASTAAPHYFEPELIQVTKDAAGAFVDGGVSPHNNPALQLLMLATLDGYCLRWPMGSEKLLVVSVGTGSMEPRLDADAVMKMPAAALAMRSLASLMDDASALNETILQWMSSRSTFRVIDREIGDLRDDHLGPDGALISYVRYDVQLDQRWLKENLELEYTPRKLSKIDQMDRPDNMDDLESIGRAAGKRLVEDDHFPGVFDSVSTT